jgi:copper oxidase (laccase) domain-containing protein
MMRLEAPELGCTARPSSWFFHAPGRVSEGPFTSLNIGRRSGDRPEHVDANRARAAQAIGFQPQSLVTAVQIHSPICLTAHEPWPADAAPEADALATDRPSLLLGVLTADCAPVLLA